MKNFCCFCLIFFVGLISAFGSITLKMIYLIRNVFSVMQGIAS